MKKPITRGKIAAVLLALLLALISHSTRADSEEPPINVNQETGILLTKRGHLIESEYDALISVFLRIEKPEVSQRGSDCGPCAMERMTFNKLSTDYPQCALHDQLIESEDSAENYGRKDIRMALMECVRANCTHLGSSRVRTSEWYGIKKIGSKTPTLVPKKGWSELNIPCVLSYKDIKAICRSYRGILEETLDEQYNKQVEELWSSLQGTGAKAGRMKRQANILLAGTSILGTGASAYNYYQQQNLAKHVEGLGDKFQDFITSYKNIELEELKAQAGFIKVLKTQDRNLEKLKNFGMALNCNIDSMVNEGVRQRDLANWKEQVLEILNIDTDQYTQNTPRFFSKSLMKEISETKMLRNTSYFQNPDAIQTELSLLRLKTSGTSNSIEVHLIIVLPVFQERLPYYELTSVPVQVDGQSHCVKMKESFVYIKEKKYHSIDETCTRHHGEIVCVKRVHNTARPLHCISDATNCDDSLEITACRDTIINSISGVLTATAKPVSVRSRTNEISTIQNSTDFKVTFVAWTKASAVIIGTRILSSPMAHGLSQEIKAPKNTNWGKFLAAVPTLEGNDYGALESNLRGLTQQVESMTFEKTPMNFNKLTLEIIALAALGLVILTSIASVCCVVKGRRQIRKLKRLKDRIANAGPSRIDQPNTGAKTGGEGVSTGRRSTTAEETPLQSSTKTARSDMITTGIESQKQDKHIAERDRWGIPSSDSE